jgi:hypothetical protein
MWKTILAYGSIWVHRIAITRPSDWILNVAAVSIPCQIVPSFYYLYSRSFTRQFLFFNWFGSWRDILVCIAGCGITALVAVGAFRLRRVFLPEIWLFLLMLFVAAPITTSTTRYLLPMQFLTISCFLCGARHVFGRWTGALEDHRYLAMVSLSAFLLAIGLLHGVGSKGRFSSSISSLRESQENVASTYKALDLFLSRLEVDKTRLLYFSADPGSGKWTAIRGLHYVAPDAGLQSLVRESQVYAVFDQPRRVDLDYIRDDDSAMLATLSQWGRFNVERVLDASNSNAYGRVYRITSADAK